jgi:drug/metabolite transporter (DMT)-like permease
VKLFDNPLFLLLSTGLLLGLYMPIGKYVGAAGIDPILWAIVISLFPGLVLLAFSGGIGARHLVFGLVAGLTAYVIPNSLSFAAIPHVGAGYVGLMFAVSPIFTAAISMLFNIRPPDQRLLISVACGFAGAAMIVLFRQKLSLGGSGPWPLIAFLIPLSLACGNVYRTARWPQGSSPTQVGAAANLGAMPLLALALIVFADRSGISTAAHHPLLVLMQIAVSLAMFLVFFRLQWVGGPTYLSQIGYVAAAVSLAFGTLWFNEDYPWQVWLGAALIGAGVVFSNIRQSSPRQAQ